MRGQSGGAERAAELVDHAAERDRLRLHQVPGHRRRLAGIARGEPGDGGGDVLAATGWNGVADSAAGRSIGNAASARSIALPP